MRYSRCRLMITRKPDNTDYLPLSLVMFHSSDECSLILVHTGPVISPRLRHSSPAAFACRLETHAAIRTVLCRDKTVNTSVTPVRETLGGSHRDIANPIVIFGPSRSFFLSPLHPQVSAAPRAVLFIIVVIIYEQRINGGGASSLMSLPPWHGIGNNNDNTIGVLFFFPRA